MSASPEGEPPPPPLGPAGAVAATACAWFASVAVSALFIGWASAPTAIAIGVAAGFGGVATWLARQVPPPAEHHLGLRALSTRFVPILLLLVPAALLASEIDNAVTALFPVEPPGPDALGEPDPLLPEEPGAEAADPETVPAWLLAEAIVAMVLLRPVVEEFFFRGVLLQGLVLRLGVAAGITATALLSALSDAAFNLNPDPAIPVSTFVQGVFVGVLLGVVRLASGSLLAPILLLAAIRGLGGLAVAFSGAFPIPGFNAPGASTPPEYIGFAFVSVVLGLLLTRREWRSRDVGEENPRGECPTDDD